MNNKFYADAMGFLDLPGKPPIADKNLIQPEIGANINLIHLTTAKPWLETTEEVLAAHREFVKTLKEQKIFKDKDDLKPFADGTNKFTVGVILGLQNAPNDILENNNLKVLYDEGVRIMAIAYEDRNAFRGGCMVPNVFLKKDKGRKFLTALAENGIIFDFSHAGFRTADDIVEFVRNENIPLKVMASHSGFANSFFHFRNILDRIVEFIVSRNGIIGIPTLNFILDEKDNNLYAFMKHIKNLINFIGEYGEDKVCVGSDGVYKRFWEEQLKAHQEIMLKNIKYKDEWRVRYPEHPLNTYTPCKMEIIAERLSDFFSQNVVDKL